MIACIAIQCIKRLGELYSMGLIHRDIKPENFMLDDKNNNIVNIIDFGLSKSYIRNKTHTPFRDDKSLVGTARYTSIYTHRGYDQSRRDDLISVGYMLAYFFYKGQLPWQGLVNKNEKNETRYVMIKRIKEKTSLRVLCNNLPVALYKHLNYCYRLQFEEKPNYSYLISLWKECIRNENFISKEHLLFGKGTDNHIHDDLFLSDRQRNNRLSSVHAELSNGRLSHKSYYSGASTTRAHSTTN